MTRPDLVFANSQLSELQYVCGTYDQGITYCDLGAEVVNKVIGWVDSDLGSYPDTREQHAHQ